MARISLIICDLCKKQMEEGDAEHAIALIASKREGDKEEIEYSGEICTECFETLRNWLLAPTDAALEKPNKSLNDGLHDMVLGGLEETPVAPVAQIKALTPPPASDGDRGKINEGELNVVKSNFDKTSATRAVKKIKGSCDHHFKSFNEGKIVCGGAPDGYTGEFAGDRGCGKTLTEKEF